MSRNSFLQRPSHGAVLIRLVFAAALLFTLTLVGVFGTVIWTGHWANDAASERQRAQVQTIVRQSLRDLAGHLDEILATPSGATLPGPLEGSRHFDRLVLVGDANSGPPLPPHLEALVHSGSGEPVLLSDGTSVDAAVVRRLPGRNAEVLIGIKRYGEADLRRDLERLGIEDAQISFTRPAHGGFVSVPDAAGAPRAFLSWTPDLPGDVLRQRLMPALLFGSAISLGLFVLLVLYTRWLAGDLARSQEQAQDLLGRDPLSRLPNRLLFTERLDQEISRLARVEDGIALMFLDLDRFKDVNDTFGHPVGDELIKQVATRLSDLLRGADTLARFGGDEFAVIQTGIRSSSDAEALARRILDALGRPFEIAGTPVSIGVSIGIALAPENGISPEVLMRLADTALYQAKSEGRNRFSFFERAMDEAILMRKVVEDDLRHAIQRDELTLHYQPLYSADGQTIQGVEALVRWPHPTQGMISPARFIPIAEERGLVIPLGEWVLRRACQDGKRWPGLRIAVNVSPLQFRHRNFVDGVVRILGETNFDPARLELELTEGVVVDDADAAEAAMMELRALGINLALDDFGTGYSSLIYLRRFAFDKIKIDRSFLESMEATGESAILVHSIVHLGRALGLTVTAEGVETKEQHRFLQALGCHQLQGFLFSKPVPPEQIDALLGGEMEARVA